MNSDEKAPAKAGEAKEDGAPAQDQTEGSPAAGAKPGKFRRLIQLIRGPWLPQTDIKELEGWANFESVDRQVVQRLVTRGKLLALALDIEQRDNGKAAAPFGLVLGTNIRWDKDDSAQASGTPGQEKREVQSTAEEAGKGQPPVPSNGSSQSGEQAEQKSSEGAPGAGKDQENKTIQGREGQDRQEGPSTAEEAEKGQPAAPSNGSTQSNGQAEQKSGKGALGASKGQDINKTISNKAKVPVFGYTSAEIAALENVVHYRIAMTDLFVEKAQFYLEDRAKYYFWIAAGLFFISLCSIATGTLVALSNIDHPPGRLIWTAAAKSDPAQPHQGAGALGRAKKDEGTPAGTKKDEGTPAGAKKDEGAPAGAKKDEGPPPAGTKTEEAAVESQEAAVGPNPWHALLSGFIRSFTAYGFLVLLAVISARAAKAFMDQREQLLTRRHSLRQGRLFLHLNGGLATAEDLKVAFDWNHSQPNAFSAFDPDAKAPWGNVLEELVKVIPEVAKATANNSSDRPRLSFRRNRPKRE